MPRDITLVGKGGFEPPASASRTLRANQTAPLPEFAAGRSREAPERRPAAPRILRLAQEWAGTNCSSVASGGQAKRAGENRLVPRPGLTWSHMFPTRLRPRARAGGRLQLVTRAPKGGIRTWPPCV